MTRKSTRKIRNQNQIIYVQVLLNDTPGVARSMNSSVMAAVLLWVTKVPWGFYKFGGSVIIQND